MVIVGKIRRGGRTCARAAPRMDRVRSWRGCTSALQSALPVPTTVGNTPPSLGHWMQRKSTPLHVHTGDWHGEFAEPVEHVDQPGTVHRSAFDKRFWEPHRESNPPPPFPAVPRAGITRELHGDRCAPIKQLSRMWSWVSCSEWCAELPECSW